MSRLDTFNNFVKYQILAINLDSVTNIPDVISKHIMYLLSLKGSVVVITRQLLQQFYLILHILF